MKKTIYQIAKIDGVSQILLCPEMDPEETWKYRVRYLDEPLPDVGESSSPRTALPPLPTSLTEWRYHDAMGPQVVIPSVAPTYKMEVETAQAIPASMLGAPSNDLEWSKAALRELSMPTALFSVLVKEEVSIASEDEASDKYLIRAMATVRGGVSVYDIEVPLDVDGAKLVNGELVLKTGSSFELEGKAHSARVHNVLIDEGDFVTVSPRIEVYNLTASEGNFCAGDCHDSRCRTLPSENTFFMAASGEKLTDDERRDLAAITKAMKGEVEAG